MFTRFTYNFTKHGVYSQFRSDRLKLYRLIIYKMEKVDYDLCKDCTGKLDKTTGLPIVEDKQTKYKYPSLASDAIVLRKKNDRIDILLIKRGREPFKGKYAFPGGFVDYNEDPIEGCLRELKEETNLIGQKIELFTVRSKPDRDPRSHVVSLMYYVEVDSNSEPKAGDDAAHAQFYDLAEIVKQDKSEFSFDHYEVIQELVTSKFNTLF